MIPDRGFGFDIPVDPGRASFGGRHGSWRKRWRDRRARLRIGQAEIVQLDLRVAQLAQSSSGEGAVES
jgi:hypothetical protein